jgi:hypothetical protein
MKEAATGRKRTLKRESKVLETVGREGVSTSIHLPKNQRSSGISRSSGYRELALRVGIGGL